MNDDRDLPSVQKTANSNPQYPREAAENAWLLGEIQARKASVHSDAATSDTDAHGQTLAVAGRAAKTPNEIYAEQQQEAARREAAVLEAIGVWQTILFLRDQHPEECEKQNALMNASIDDDNRTWSAKRKGSGDVITLVQRVVSGLTREEAAELIRSWIEGISEEVRWRLAPDADPNALDPDARFPAEALPKVALDYVNASAELNGSRPELSAAAILAVASASLGKGLELTTIRGRRTSGNLYILVGMPSAGGKSVECKPIFASFTDFESRCISTHQQQAREAEVRLEVVRRDITALVRAAKKGGPSAILDTSRLAELRTEEATLLARMRPPQHLTDDATGEALNKIASENNGTMAILSTDARGQMKNMYGRYRPGDAIDEDSLLKGFSGDPIRQDRITREAVRTEPRFTIFLATQPDYLAQMFGQEELSTSGLAPRFLACQIDADFASYAYRQSEFPSNIAEAFHTRMWELLETYHQRRGEPWRISPTNAAGQIIVDYDNSVRGRICTGELEPLASFAARWAEQAWRVALVLHALEHRAATHLHDLQESTAQAAVHIVQWFCRQQLALLGAAGGKKDTEKLDVAREFVRRNPAGVIPYDLLRHRQTLFADADDAAEVLNVLVNEGSIRWEAGSRKGKGRYFPLEAPRRR